MNFALITMSFTNDTSGHSVPKLIDVTTANDLCAQRAMLSFKPELIVEAMVTSLGRRVSEYIGSSIETLYGISMAMMSTNTVSCYAIERLDGFKYTLAFINHPDSEYSLVGVDELPDFPGAELVGSTGDVSMYIMNDNPDGEIYVLS